MDCDGRDKGGRHGNGGYSVTCLLFAGRISGAMPYLRALIFVAALAGALIFAAPVQALARRRGWALQHRIQTGFCHIMCAIIGVKITRDGPLPGPAPRFVVANHVSWTDIIALASLYPFVFLAKGEVATWPVLGFLAQLQGTVFVDRGARGEVARVNDSLVRELRAGNDLVVFAEGTSSDGTRVLPFNAGHFAPLTFLDPTPTLAPAAIRYLDRAGAHIDVGWYGDMTFLPHLWSLIRRGGDVECHIRFGEAIATRGKDRKALAAETQARIRDMLALTDEENDAGAMGSRKDHAARRSGPPK